MPYCDIPDPYGCHNSYAEHFEKEFEESLQVFGLKWNSYINMLNIEVEDITKTYSRLYIKEKKL